MPWAGLRLAVTLLTAIPLPGGRRAGQDAPGRRAAAWAMAWAPLVGVGLGAAAAGVLILATRYGHAGSLLSAALAVTVLAALSRALHLDGLADTADGLGSRQPAARALEIMKQSDVGPFGVVVLVLTLLLQVSALARADQLGRGPVAIAAAAVTARLAIVLACRRGVPSARPGGLGALVAGSVRPLVAVAWILAGLGAAAAFGWRYAAAMAVGLTLSAGLTALATSRFGGITGDVLGAAAEIAAAGCLLVTALR
jgi:adenosylcobinamide-GDP ribazoletransferase